MEGAGQFERRRRRTEPGDEEHGGGETYPNLPSIAAAPPGMILVMKIPGSSGMWGLSSPPAMLKPRPEFPCTQVMMSTFSTVKHTCRHTHSH